jgi:CheY-like chemotaxis protein
MDRQSLRAHAQTALENLLQPSLLQIHPLAAILLPDQAPVDRGPALKALLLDAMQRIRPSNTVAFDSPVWRRYRSLFHFYVEGQSFAEIAREQGVSERQSRRDLHQAVDGVVDFLWAWYGQIHQTEDWAAGEGQSSTSDSDPIPAKRDPDWESEITRIGSLPSDEPVHLDLVLRDVVCLAETLASRLGTPITLVIGDALPPVAVNQTALRHILIALLGWVLDLGRGGGMTISAAEIGRWVDVSIRADSRLHDRAAVEDDSRRQLSERLLELQRAKLDVQRPGPAEIRLRLRLPTSQIPTILVVDDNPDVLRLFQRYVQSPGVHFVQATNAEQALRHLHEARPRLLTLDLMMPGRDGWDLLQALARDPAARDIPIAVCSVVHERALALAMGATYFLPKPISRGALLEVLEQCGLRPVDRLET